MAKTTPPSAAKRPKPAKPAKAEKNPAMRRAYDLWRASGGLASSTELVRLLAGEGLKATDNNIRAWKSRHRWKLPKTHAAVRRELARETQFPRGMQADKPGNPAHLGAAVEDLTGDLIATAPEQPEDSAGADHVERMEMVQRQLQRMIGAAGRKFQVALRTFEIESSEDFLNVARAAAMMADSIARLGDVIGDAKRPIPSRVSAFADALKAEATVIDARPEPKDITPVSERRLANVLHAFKT